MSMSNSNLETHDISIQETNSLSFKQGNVLSHIVRQLTESVSPHFLLIMAVIMICLFVLDGSLTS